MENTAFKTWIQTQIKNNLIPLFDERGFKKSHVNFLFVNRMVLYNLFRLR